MQVTIIDKSKLNMMLDEEEKSGKECISYVATKDYSEDGFQYDIWKDERNGKCFAVRRVRCVHMGFNSNEAGKEQEFEDVMKREGICKASWGCTGRTLHQMLANQLAAKYPQYEWTIGYNYECMAEDKHRMVLMAGFEPMVEM